MGEPVDAVFDVAGKTPAGELISLVSEPSQVLSIANFAADQAGARVTGGGADSRPLQALAEVAELLAQNKLVIKVQTFPFDRAAEAYRISQGGHVPGIPDLLRDSESVLSGYLSLSSSAPHLFGDRLDDFAGEVRALLASRSAEGIFWDWPGDTEVIMARKPGCTLADESLRRPGA